MPYALILFMGGLVNALQVWYKRLIMQTINADVSQRKTKRIY